LNSIVHFFHHLFNPHCSLCIHYEELKNKCVACEVLERQLEIERQYNQLLLNKITNPIPSVIPQEIQTDKEEPKSIRRGPRSFVPFAVKEQMARQNDEQTLELLKKHQAESQIPISVPSLEIVADVGEKIEKLESEILGVNLLQNNG
jgi:hypothetical protein